MDNDNHILVQIGGWKYSRDSGVHEASESCNDRPDGKPPCEPLYVLRDNPENAK